MMRIVHMTVVVIDNAISVMNIDSVISDCPGGSVKSRVLLTIPHA
jgi:hypothetical protein